VNRIIAIACLLAVSASAQEWAWPVLARQASKRSASEPMWAPSFVDNILVWTDFSSSFDVSIGTHADTYYTNLVPVVTNDGAFAGLIYREWRPAAAQNAASTNPIAVLPNGNAVGYMYQHAMCIPGSGGAETLAYPVPGGPVSMAAWFFPTAFNGNANTYFFHITVLGGTGAVGFRWISSTELRSVAGAGGTTFNFSTPTNAWTHFAYVCEGSTNRIYANGQSVFSFAANAGTNYYVSVGKQLGFGAPNVLGLVDDLILVKGDIGLSGVQELYNRGAPSARSK
jgi:hypothetical protein